ncbi:MULTISPECIES: hypothetical protein [unclassified Arthrobacter]|uniref:hypothetical protein n=1 Tax=unclassified Arthrobacter TaxID=235627 RepID=UPI001E291D96|nr:MULTISPECIES: hypothetical protein [unclassified Arthrobacter]MCC9144504.1 hypothetical protein [Arthrobacter sp. zg-Y919]MDK1275730.1 hypothetical protein [Arthrobacter sp. zg.Y919]WIB02903.1 hypothetical protein QNO10_13335 [Arthrobacter sp. zg-Y919]
MSAHSIIYLHRSVNQNEEDWVLRKNDLDTEWRDKWESVIAAANLSAPIVIFVGLGSPANVLTESVARLTTKANSSYFLVDRNQESKFSEALGVNLTGSVGLYWGEFMQKLAERVTTEHLHHLTEAHEQLAKDEPSMASLQTRSVTAPLENIDLLKLGSARSTWLLETSKYTAEGDSARRQHIAHLLLGLDRLKTALSATSVELDDHGRFKVNPAHGAPMVVGMAHGKGLNSWAGISTKVRNRNEGLAPQNRTGIVMVAGATNSNVDLSGVDDLIRASNSGDLIRGADTLFPLFVDEFLHAPLSEVAATIDGIMR